MDQSWRSGCAMACVAPGELSELCTEHHQSLNVFCLDDLQPLCQQCAEESHSQHRVYPVSEAAADCKGELSASLHNLNEKKSAFDKSTQDYHEISKHNQVFAELTEEQIKKEFEELHRILLKEEADRLLLLRQEKDERISELQEQSKLMDDMVRSLEERIRLTEAELDSGGDGVQFLKDYQEAQKRESENLKKPKRTFLLNVAKHLGNLKFLLWSKMKHYASHTPVTLDPRTAGQGLAVPFPLNRLQSLPDADEPGAPSVPDHPERFHPYSSVVAREGFSSGVHCWEIEVCDCDNWTVGVASESIARRVQFDACPEAGLWSICLRDRQYLALTSPARTLPLDMSHPLKRIRVRLDFDRGILEFHNSETDASVFTFNHNFTETVYPYFETVSISGSLCVVPNEVRVSVTLEGDIIEEPENQEINSSQTDPKSKENKTKKRIVKNGLIKTKPTINQTPTKILFSDEYHVSLFRLQKNNAVTCNQIKHG